MVHFVHNKLYIYVLKKSYFIFPITKGSVNALMKLAGFSTSNKVNNHCTRLIFTSHSKQNSDFWAQSNSLGAFVK